MWIVQPFLHFSNFCDLRLYLLLCTLTTRNYSSLYSFDFCFCVSWNCIVFILVIDFCICFCSFYFNFYSIPIVLHLYVELIEDFFFGGNISLNLCQRVIRSFFWFVLFCFCWLTAKPFMGLKLEAAPFKNFIDF